MWIERPLGRTTTLDVGLLGLGAEAFDVDAVGGVAGGGAGAGAIIAEKCKIQ